MNALQNELRQYVLGEVRFDSYTKALYSTDASIYEIEPIGVVIPRDRADVVATVKLAGAHKVPVLPRGGGTSLAGQTVGAAIHIDFSKYMNRVLEVNPEERWVRVQPGIVLDELNAQLKPYGLFFPPDPATSNRANIGGMIGNNSCGSHSILYGKTIDHVKELSVVLSDGEEVLFRPMSREEVEAKERGEGLEGQIYREVRRLVQENREEVLRRYPKIMRRVSGYNLDAFLGEEFNLAKLIVGSEGTLATVVEAKLNLVPRPKQTALLVAHFRGLIEAMEATVEILPFGPSAVELMDQMMLGLIQGSLDYARRLAFVHGSAGALLIVEFSGDMQEGLTSKLSALEAHLRHRELGYAFVRILDHAEQEDLWTVRKAGLGFLMGMKGDVKPLNFVEDTAVAPERLPEYISRFDATMRELGTEAAYYGHASVGCVHIQPLINLKEPSGVERMQEITRRISDLVLEFGGALSGEHGDGLLRSAWNEKMFGPVLYRAFQAVKRAFDPQGIMNPGKIVDAQPMTENLRFATYHPLELETELDFSADGGIHRAVELCSGLGACRKTLGGTMCPSYHATREEEHSTRGRANALRAALSGRLPREELTSKRMYDVLDLCVECKACKAECPSNVDMAKLKVEFLAQYYKVHRLPLRARLFGNLAALSRLGCFFAPLSNWIAGSAPARWALHRFLGIDRRRALPAFVRPTFRAWFNARSAVPDRAWRGEVVLFDDTYMDYYEPEIGKAAVQLLEAAGFRVALPDKRCCGRPLIHEGMLEQARANARHNVQELFRHVEQGRKIVVCEPSCASALRDEYPDLLRDERAKEVAKNTFTLEEFLHRLHQAGELELAFKPVQKRLLFHGHCHQKALAGTGAAMAVLRLPPGYQVEEIDAGCCGMAGSFGYEAEHYDISLAIGDLRLFPAVRARQEGTEIVSDGVSCRQQVQHATGVRARHIAEVLAEAL